MIESMKSVKVILDQKRCTGAGSCILKDSSVFKLVGKKAFLVDGKKVSHEMILDVDEKNRKKVIAAGLACPSNAIRVVDKKTKKELVRTRVESQKAKVLKASYDEKKEWRMDPKGYFLIRIDNGIIEVGHCNEKNSVDVIITGTSETEIMNTILREKLVSSLQHAAYLGKELYKAKIALREKKKYVQDDTVYKEKFD